jgi:serine/threonine-protein kinase
MGLAVAPILRWSRLIVQPSRLDGPDPSNLDDCDPSELPSIPHAYAKGDLVAGKYLLCQHIGEGGMGLVWRAQDIFLNVPVALKLLRREHRLFAAQREYLSERLTREATTLAGLRHPAIVRVFDFGTSCWNDPYVAMELLEGESLGALIDRSGQLIPEYAVQIMLPIAHGLAAAHQLGVVHRDLKPDNLYLSIDGRIQPKVIDFGLVKLTRGQPGRKLTGVGLLGTLEYMSPEQALELPDVDQRSDVWAFSVVLYEALSGTLPFSEPTSADTLCAILQKPPAPLTAIGLDPALWEIVERGLCKNPLRRWQSMEEMGNSLANWLHARGVTVDVTGAALHTQWKLVEGGGRAIDVKVEPVPAPLGTYRTEHSSGVQLRQDVPSPPTKQARVRLTNPRRETFFWRPVLRLALSGAVAGGIMMVPDPAPFVHDAKALVSSVTGIDLGPANLIPDAARSTNVVHHPPLEGPLASP